MHGGDLGGGGRPRLEGHQRVAHARRRRSPPRRLAADRGAPGDRGPCQVLEELRVGREQHGHLSTLPPAPGPGRPGQQPRRRILGGLGSAAAERATRRRRRANRHATEAAHEQDRHGAVGRRPPARRSVARRPHGRLHRAGRRAAARRPGRSTSASGTWPTQGYAGVLTAALGPLEQRVFLRPRLHGPRAPPPAPPSRSTHADRPPGSAPPAAAAAATATAVLEVDHLAFEPFWRFDLAGLDDARRATPVVAVPGGATAAEVDGYAVTGRAGRDQLPPAPGRAPRPPARAASAPALVLDALHWAQRRGATLDAGQHPGAQPPARWRSTSSSASSANPTGSTCSSCPWPGAGPDHVTGAIPPPAPAARPAAAVGILVAADRLVGAGPVRDRRHLPDGARRRRRPRSTITLLVASRPGSGPTGVFELRVAAGACRPTRRSWPASTCPSAPRTSWTRRGRGPVARRSWSSR